MPLIEGERIQCRCGKYVVVSDVGAFHEDTACPEFIELMQTLGAEDKGTLQGTVYDAPKIQIMPPVYGHCPACQRVFYRNNEICNCVDDDLSVDTKRSN